MPFDDEVSLLDVVRLHGRLEQLAEHEVLAGDVLYRQGEPGETFALIVEGVAVVLDDAVEVTHLGIGAIVGELALFTGEPRVTSVVAVTRLVCRLGTAQDFEELLEIDEIRTAMLHVAATRLATNVTPVPFMTPKGLHGVLRPLLPTDRADYVERIKRMSPEVLRLRFFSAARPNSRLVDYLLSIDYLNHFAWVVADLPTSTKGDAAIGRFIRNRTKQDEAEIAFTVFEEHQGKGLGSVLVGAIAVAARNVGIVTLTAEVLAENTPMRRVFDKAKASWNRVEPGVVAATMAVDAAIALLPDGLAGDLADAVHSLGLAAATVHASGN